MRFAVLQFPGSNCDQDSVHVLGNVLGHDADYLWHKEESIGNADAVVVPGGFSYGDHLRTGSIAQFSPVMNAVKAFANDGGLVIGICNGFQILCECGLLPGALVRNRSLQFRCEHVYLKVATHNSPFTSQVPEKKILRIPIAHGEAYASEIAGAELVTFKDCAHSIQQEKPGEFAAEVKKLVYFDRMSINICDKDISQASMRHSVGLDVPGRDDGDTWSLDQTPFRDALISGKTILRSDTSDRSITPTKNIWMPAFAR